MITQDRDREPAQGPPASVLGTAELEAYFAHYGWPAARLADGLVASTLTDGDVSLPLLVHIDRGAHIYFRLYPFGEARLHPATDFRRLLILNDAISLFKLAIAPGDALVVSLEYPFPWMGYDLFEMSLRLLAQFVREDYDDIVMGVTLVHEGHGDDAPEGGAGIDGPADADGVGEMDGDGGAK